MEIGWSPRIHYLFYQDIYWVFYSRKINLSVLSAGKTTVLYVMASLDTYWIGPLALPWPVGLSCPWLLLVCVSFLSLHHWLSPLHHMVSFVWFALVALLFIYIEHYTFTHPLTNTTDWPLHTYSWCVLLQFLPKSWIVTISLAFLYCNCFLFLSANIIPLNLSIRKSLSWQKI